MAEITIKEVRDAIVYVQNSRCELALSDEQLLKADFFKDLGMGNIRVMNVFIELQRRHRVFLSLDLFEKMEDNTVGAFLNAVNGAMPA